MPRLIVKMGPDTGASVVLNPAEKLTLGRSSELGFRLHDPRTSRKHVVFGFKDGRWLLKNLSPANGTFVNGRMLESSEVISLKDGDRIEIGNSLLELVDEQNARNDPLIGKTIGNYHIHRELGRGGAGIVYLATQVQLGRQVALKTLLAELASDPSHVERFYQEGRSTAAVNHHRVITVHDAGKFTRKATRNGQVETLEIPYFACEYAPYGSVHDEARLTGNLPLVRVLDVAYQCLEALEHLEQEGVVHRDIKPQNLFCFPRSIVKLGDLGLAVSKQEVSMPRGGMLGTPHYVSPEQARGQAMDHRADLYSLGATIYRLVTGRCMFAAASAKEIARCQVREYPQPMVTHRANVPPQLEQIVGRMLMKDPAERFQSASEVKQILPMVPIPHEDLSAWSPERAMASNTGHGTTSHTPAADSNLPESQDFPGEETPVYEG